MAKAMAAAVGSYVDLETASRSGLVLRRFIGNRKAVFGMLTVVFLFAIANLGPFFMEWNHIEQDFTAMQAAPSFSHLFGTTQTGYDVLARTLRGLQKSLVIGLLGALIATSFAAVVGAFAGYYGRALNYVLSALIDVLLVLPAFLIVAILSPLFVDKTWLLLVLLLASFQWMITARIVRGMTLSLKEREFVQAARFMGVSGPRIIFRHILPNMASLLIIDATVNVSALILAEVGLSFFGFGVQSPDVSLGTMIQEHWQSALSYPWQFYFPTASLFVLVIFVNLMGDGLRDAFDPHSAQ